MIKKYLILFIFCFTIGMISAVPQVIFTEVNLTIEDGSFSLVGEGVNAEDSFPIVVSNESCSFSYQRDNIPLTFSREIGSNDTDVAKLIHSLEINNNMTLRWETCVNELIDTRLNLSMCKKDVGYESNYTICSGQLTSCQNEKTTVDNQVATLTEEKENLKSTRNIWAIGCIVLGVATVILYRKSQVKTVVPPIGELPESMRQ